MRAVLVVSLVVLIAPVAALAQATPAPATPTPPSAAPAPSAATAAPRATTRGGDIARAEYIERAVERAKRAAEKRFDKMDANHDGVLSAEERGAARSARSKRKSSSQ